MSIEKTIFGTTKDGREVTAYTLRNIRGMRVKISSLGAAIVSVEALHKITTFFICPFYSKE